MALTEELDFECLLCNETIKCQKNDTSVLVDHAKLKHPDIKISNIPKELIISRESKKKTSKDKIRNSNSNKGKKTGKPASQIMEEKKPAMEQIYPPQNTGKGKSKNVAQNPPKKAVGRRRIYKTSVEKWKPGRDKILCPKCDAIVRPIIRSSANRVSHSSFGAALIMTCWPFCFFPFLFPAPVQENLHCSICGYFFGSYDHQKQTMNVPKEKSKNVSKEQTENVTKEPEQNIKHHVGSDPGVIEKNEEKNKIEK